MKVITKERLRELKKYSVTDASKTTIDCLIEECQELDTLTVTSLRPMCDAPKDEDSEFFVKFKEGDTLKPVVIFEGKILDHYHDWINQELLEGWLPFPRYEPEKV